MWFLPENCIIEMHGLADPKMLPKRGYSEWETLFGKVWLDDHKLGTRKLFVFGAQRFSFIFGSPKFTSNEICIHISSWFFIQLPIKWLIKRIFPFDVGALSGLHPFCILFTHLIIIIYT